MVKDYGESISTIDAEAAAADRAEKAKFDRMLSSMSGGRNTGGGTMVILVIQVVMEEPVEKDQVL